MCLTFEHECVCVCARDCVPTCISMNIQYVNTRGYVCMVASLCLLYTRKCECLAVFVDPLYVYCSWFAYVSRVRVFYFEISVWGLCIATGLILTTSWQVINTLQVSNLSRVLFTCCTKHNRVLLLSQQADEAIRKLLQWCNLQIWMKTMYAQFRRVFFFKSVNGSND